MPILSLCGFMGAGKTTIGKNLAHYLGYKFIDLDWYLEEKLGTTVSNFFSNNGECAFREQEALALKEIIDNYSTSKGVVLALGGGALTNSLSAKIIKDNTTCFYLNCSNEVLLKRLQKSDTERPLLKGKNIKQLKEFIENKKIEREQAYIDSASFIRSEERRVGKEC